MFTNEVLMFQASRVRAMGFTVAVMMMACIEAVVGYFTVEASRSCRHDGECAGWVGETCVQLYEGCFTGRCMCYPGQHFHNGRCDTVAEYGDYCTSHEECPLGMECFERECICEVGSRRTPDRHICLRRWQKILGDLCEPEYDVCYHRSDHSLDYISNDDILCSQRMVCECNEGLKEDGVSCKKRSLGERGCVESHHCRGGALCVAGTCLCPSGYSPVAHNSKCAKHGAVTNLPLGAACNEIEESRYCGAGLVCYFCEASGIYQCVKFLMMEQQFSLSSASQSPTHAGFHISLLFTIFYSNIS